MSRRTHDASRGRRGVLLGAVLAATLAVGQAGTLIARADPPVDTPGPPSADGVQPVIADTKSSDDDCIELGFDHGLSIAGNGQVGSGDLTVTVTGYDDPTGFADWSSNQPIHGVYVKGGPSGGNLFSYPTGDTGDQDLHTPQKPGGGFYSVSHLAFCWNDVTATAPDMTILKSNEPAGIVANGSSITYTLTVANDGDGAATLVVVTDQLAPGVTFSGATSGCNESGGLVTCALGDVGPGASLDVDITVIVDETFCGPIMNTAHVAASNESGEAAGNNDSNEVTNSVECGEPTLPDLQVTKTSDAEGVLHEGDDFLYTITVTNVGEETATGVELVDVLPPGAFNVGLPPFPTFAGEDCTVTSSLPPGGVAHTEVRCGPVTLGPGASASVTIKVFVSGEVCGAVTNVADVAGSNEPVEHVGPDNHAEATDEIACVPRIRLLKGGPAFAHVGDEITYRFLVTNTGGVDLSNVVISDPKCDGAVAFVEGDTGGDGVLGVDEEWSFRCDHVVTEGDGSIVQNQATVTGDHNGGSVTDLDTHNVDVIHPSIDLEKSATPTSGTAGTTIVYTYAVENTGDTPLFDVSVDDDQVGHLGIIPTLPAGATVELTHQITLGSSPITNVATAAGSDRLGMPVSDVDSATVTVISGGGGGNGTDGGSPFTGYGAGVLVTWIVLLATAGSLLLSGSRKAPRARNGG